jgi:hypothetical protein
VSLTSPGAELCNQLNMHCAHGVWAGLGGSAAAVIVNYLSWDVRIFEHGIRVHLESLRIPSGIFLEVTWVYLFLFHCAVVCVYS